MLSPYKVVFRGDSIREVPLQVYNLSRRVATAAAAQRCVSILCNDLYKMLCSSRDKLAASHMRRHASCFSFPFSAESVLG